MSDGSETSNGDYWYNVVTKSVEVGPQSDWSQLLGPYATRAEAEGALARVQERNEAWDNEDEE
jgi:hypothetical protein